MLTADGEVYFYFVFINHTMLDAWQTVCKTRKNWRGKEHSAPLEKFWQWLGVFQLDPGFGWSTGTRWIETTNDVRVQGGIAGGHSRKLAKIPIPNRLYQAFDQFGKSFADYKPGANWCTKCKVEADKNFKEHGNYIPRKRKACNKQKVEQTLISVSSLCTSWNINKYINNKENVIYRMPMTHLTKRTLSWKYWSTKRKV